MWLRRRSHIGHVYCCDSLTNFKSKETSRGKFLRPRPTFRTVKFELRRSTFNPPVVQPELRESHTHLSSRQFDRLPELRATAELGPLNLGPRDVQPGVPSLRMYTPPPRYWPRGETREPDVLHRRPDELCFSALGTDVMPRIMLFSTNRPIPLKIMYALFTLQVKSAPLAAAARHQFHCVSPVGGGEGEF